MTNKDNKLVALVFDDPYKADEAHAALKRMGGEGLLEIDESAVLVSDANGKVQISQDTDTVKKTQKFGHIIGLVAGAVTGTFPLILGATLAGRLIGRFRDHGVTDKFLNSLKKELQPNTSALVIFARSDPERRKQIVDRLASFNPKILESDLPAELEADLVNQMQAAQKAAAGGK